MEIYQVGGAVRDRLLELAVKDRDWVVVGATPEQMLSAGYRQVGRNFPVFLHPQSKEEYALARTERKTAPGYTGFQVHAAPDVTLEQDLQRRDLTINAIAQAADGTLIDPFGGIADLEQRRLRHVSPAFSEDPLRILRLARFTARFAPLGFTIVSETETLMQQMVEAGEVDALIPERVWNEFQRALCETQPERFIEVLRGCGALAHLLPEIDNLFGVPQPEQHHPEIDCGLHTLLVLQQACQLSPEPVVRFAALLHDLGKATTPPEEWPRHINHEARALPLIRQLCQRLRVPNEYRDLALLAAQYHTHCHRAAELRPATLLKLLEGLDAFRRGERFEQFLLVCFADTRGRYGFEQRDYPQMDRLRQARQAALKIDAGALARAGLKGQALADRLRHLRIAAIATTND